MNNVRSGLYCGLLYSIPLVFWVASQTAYSRSSVDWINISRNGVQSLWFLQMLAVAVIIPWLGWRESWQQGVVATLVMISVSLPLVAIAWLSGAADAMTLSDSLLVVVGLAIVMLLLIRLLDRLTVGTQIKVSARASMQIGTCCALWLFHDTLLTWLY